jgi:transposase-like protein
MAGSKPEKCYPDAVKRKTKIPIHEHQVTCPFCRTNLTILSPMETILLARRTCPKCKREFLVENGKTKRAFREKSNDPT